MQELSQSAIDALNAARGYDAQGNTLLAISNYRKAASWGLDTPELWFSLGMCYETTNQYEPALECWERVLHAEPDNFMAINNKADALLHMGRTDEAIPLAQKVADQGLLEGWHTIAECHLADGRKDEAIETLQILVKHSIGENQSLAYHAETMINKIRSGEINPAPPQTQTPLKQYVFGRDNRMIFDSESDTAPVYIDVDKSEAEKRRQERLKRLWTLRKV